MRRPPPARRDARRLASRRSVRLANELGFEAEARAWAERLDLPTAPAEATFELIVGAEGLGLRRVAPPTAEPSRPIRADLAAERPGAEEVVRAVRGRRGAAALGRVVDATAGLGVDGAALARAGLRVTLIEREPILHALLQDALARLAAAPEPRSRSLATRLTLLHGDAAALLPRLDPAPEVVYLDPMYPRLGGGAKRRAMTVLRELLNEREGGEEWDRALLEAAREAATRRVVLKRPTKAPPLAPGVTGSVRGRTTRFDLYPPSSPRSDATPRRDA